MSKTHKTTQAEFNRFKQAFLRTRRLLGMTTYGVSFELRPLSGLAEITINHASKYCGATLSSKIRVSDPDTDLDFEAHGVHEACHLFLGQLANLGDARYIGPNDLKEKEEEMVRVMEDMLWLMDKEEQLK